MSSKILYISRHAKSSWRDPGLSDFERPLNKRGRHDAPFMAKVLKQKGANPALIVHSPAKRAAVTAGCYHEVLGGEMRSDERIYEASVTSLIYLAQEALRSYRSVMIVGHNPALTELSNILSDRYMENIPTAGTVAISFEGEVEPGMGKELFFEYPKKYKV